MSTKRFPDEVRTNVEVGSLASAGSQRMDLRREMSPMVCTMVVVVQEAKYESMG